MRNIKGFTIFIINIKGLSKYIQAMNYLQEHRGPDGEGAWFNDNKSVGFGHRRLSIIDLEDRAAQPMRRDNISIAYNGEHIL